MGKKAKNKGKNIKKLNVNSKKKISVTNAKINVFVDKVNKKYFGLITIIGFMKFLADVFQMLPKDKLIQLIVSIVTSVLTLAVWLASMLVESGILRVEGMLYYLSFATYVICSLIYAHVRFNLTTRATLAATYFTGLIICAKLFYLSSSFWIFGFVYCSAIIWMPNKLRPHLIKITSYTF